MPLYANTNTTKQKGTKPNKKKSKNFAKKNKFSPTLSKIAQP